LNLTCIRSGSGGLRIATESPVACAARHGDE
jgi:hypothetical protein